MANRGTSIRYPEQVLFAALAVKERRNDPSLTKTMNYLIMLGLAADWERNVALPSDTLITLNPFLEPDIL